MSTRVSARISAISESATLAVDAKAKALKAAGRPVIGFGAGEPDFPTPGYIVEAAQRACAEPRFHKYTPAAGLPELRAAIAAKTARDSGYQVEPSQVLVTNGGKQAVYETFATLLDPGDEVLVPAPYWTTYPESIALAGGVIRPVHDRRAAPATWPPSRISRRPAQPDQGAAVRVAVQPDRRGVPAGAGRRDRPVAAANDLWVVTDEIYEHLVYGDAKFSSIRSQTPEIADTCVVLNGVAKTYAMTGWRVGWMIGPRDVISAGGQPAEATRPPTSATWPRRPRSPPSPGTCPPWPTMRAAFDRRRQTMTRMLNEIPGVICPEPQGAFYCYPSVKGLLGHRNRRAQAADVGRTGRPSSWTRRRWRWCRARRSVRPDISGFPARSATPISKKASAGWPSCSRTPDRHGTPGPMKCQPLISGALRGPRPLLTAPAQGAPAPAFHRRDAALDAGGAGRDRGIRLPPALTEDWPPRLSGTDERGWFRFQRLYDTARSVLRTPADVRRLLTETAEDERADGSGWLEIQVDPSGYAGAVRRYHRHDRAGP